MRKITFRFFDMDGIVYADQHIEAEIDDTNTVTKMTLIHGMPATHANISFGVEDNQWISVSDRLPELAPSFETLSINVEVKFVDGHTEKNWYAVIDEDYESYGSWDCATIGFRVQRRDVTHWRYIKEQTNA